MVAHVESDPDLGSEQQSTSFHVKDVVGVQILGAPPECKIVTNASCR